jgi:hypothetical protein
MSSRVAATVGSGTVEQVRAILPAIQRGKEPAGEGERIATQVIVANPEDFVAVDAFAASGIAVGTDVIEIFCPGNNPLPRCREVVIQNQTLNSTLRIAHHPDKVVSEGWGLFNPTTHTGPGVAEIRLPLMHNNSIYARADAGTIAVRLLIF